MPAKPVTIGALHFAKSGDAADFLRAMLQRYNVGDRVSATDQEVLRAALARHPNLGEKSGVVSQVLASEAQTLALSASGSTAWMEPPKGFPIKDVLAAELE